MTYHYRVEAGMRSTDGNRASFTVDFSDFEEAAEYARALLRAEATLRGSGTWGEGKTSETCLYTLASDEGANGVVVIMNRISEEKWREQAGG